MALINCPSCNATISDKAPKCPKCGWIKGSQVAKTNPNPTNNYHDDTNPEPPSNYELKTLCVLVLDRSGSMEGNPISQLNDGISKFISEIRGDVALSKRLELAIIQFDDQIECILKPVLIGEINNVPKLTARGGTHIIDAIGESIKLIEARKAWYRQTGQQYYRPWIVLITDGGDTSKKEFSGLTKILRDASKAKKIEFLPIGVQQADFNFLNQLATEENPPRKLDGLKFTDFFKWLSSSISINASDEKGPKKETPSMDSWASFEIS